MIITPFVVWADHPFANLLPPGFEMRKYPGREIVSVSHVASDLHVDTRDVPDDPISDNAVKGSVVAIQRELKRG